MALTEREREQKRVLAGLTRLRPKIVKLEVQRRQFYDEQNAFYIEGDQVGLKATEMARSMQPEGDIEHFAESIRQVIRKSKRASK